jgi:hypothetical protein
MYSMIGNGKYEHTYVPLNPNTLLFLEKQTEVDYSKELFIGSSEFRFSSEFRIVLTYFYIALSLILGILISFTIAQYSIGNYSKIEFSIHISCLFSIFFSLYLILYLIWKVRSFLLSSKTIFTLFAVSFNTYLILCDSRILDYFLSVESSVLKSVPYSLTFTLLTLLYRNILLDDFFHYLIISVHGCILFLSINLAFSPFSLESKLYEIFLIIIIISYNLIETNIYSYRSRLVFWRTYIEEKAVKQDSKDNSDVSNDFETEAEHLISTCEKIKNDIKYAIKAIIFKDIKLRLKNTLHSIQKIKRIIGHSKMSITVKLENQVKDQQDREFIQQNYQDVSISSHGDFHRSSTIVNFMEHKNFGLFHDYGMQELSSVLEGIGKNWSFDIWFVKETTGRSISIVGSYLIRKLGLVKRFKISDDSLEKYLNAMEYSYKDCPYHNACHAGDVLHTLMYFYINSDIQKYLNPIETLASILAALGHDVSHPGVTSRYLITTRDPLAIQFNDSSVLENMHCATIFQLMNKAGFNIFENLDNEDWTCSRRIILEMVLATDMAKHFEILGKFRARASILGDLGYDKFEDKLLIFSAGIKAADIGHSAKYNDLHQKWSKLVLEEFFRQGDLEKSKNIPVSMYCDRTNTSVGKSQAGFLKNICLPLYEVWVKFLDCQSVEKVLKELRNNIEFWDATQKSRRSTQPIERGSIDHLDAGESLPGSHN